MGSAVVRALQSQGYGNLVLRTHDELDLTDQAAVRRFFDASGRTAVIMAAARVGGIHANNSQPAGFIRDNLVIQDNVIDSALPRRAPAKFVFLGSSCIYPKLAPQPIKEEYLLTGPAGADQRMVCRRQDRRTQDVPGLSGANTVSTPYALMPTNLYGPGDNFDLQNSHVLPALIRRVP